MEKKISEMTATEILRQQLELLAEESKNATGLELQGSTLAMTNVICSMERMEGQKNILPEIPDCMHCKEFQSKMRCNVKELEVLQDCLDRKVVTSLKKQGSYIKVQIACTAIIFMNLVILLIHFATSLL